MKRIEKFFLIAASLFAIASCEQKPQVSVKADFTTDKDVYELYEDIKITNTSVATNDIIVACKWEWGTESFYGKQLANPISFDSVGEKVIRLTVTTDTNVSATCEKTVTIQDTNGAPVADFTWTPATGIVAGDEVQFTDASTDPDGSVVAWEWKFGSNTVTEQNPKFTFNEFGDIEVTLTVTDNMKKKGSVKKTVHVDKSPNSLELVWAQPYDTYNNAYVKFTSPATNADGSVIYAFSSGLHLAAFDTEGKQKWSLDANQYQDHLPANQLTSSGKNNGSACQPSVDADGTIYLAVAYNEANGNTKTTNESGVYAINPDGTVKWYFPYGNARFVNIVPVVLEGDLFLATKSNPTAADFPAIWEGQSIVDNGIFLNKATGQISQVIQIKRGSYGGFAVTKEETIMVHCDDLYGTRVLWKDAEGGRWKFYGANAGQDAFVLGYISGQKNTECGFTTFSAVDAANRVYMAFGKSQSGNNSNGVLYCYDLTKYDKSAGAPAPEWTLELTGTINRYYSHGTVLGEDGTVYVTTRKALTAVAPDGTKKWEVAVSGEGYSIWGCPAVDNQGYIYFNESEKVDDVETVGKLVKIKPDGTKASEVVLGTSVCSAPTISPDGTIYCTGMKDGAATLFAVKGSATAPGAGWSQFGFSSRKTCKAE